MIVFIEGKKVSIKEPRPVILAKYGLSLTEWKNIVAEQGYRCPICERVLDKTTNIDHFHISKWMSLPPEKRKLYVRGVTCWFDNKNVIAKGITIEKAKRLVEYLERFEKKLNDNK